eukprot:tig00000144_g9167.t1
MAKLCYVGTPPKRLVAALGGATTTSFDDAEIVLVSCATLAGARKELFESPPRSVSGKIVVAHTGPALLRPGESQELDLQVVLNGGRYAEIEVFAPKQDDEKLSICVGCLNLDVFERLRALVTPTIASVINTGLNGTSTSIRLALSTIAASDVVGFALSVAMCKLNGVPLEKFMIILRQSALYSPAYEKCLAIMQNGQLLDAHSDAELSIPCKVSSAIQEIRSLLDQSEYMSIDMSLARTVAAAYERCPGQAHVMSIYDKISRGAHEQPANNNNNTEEEVAIVDENNQVIGSATRKQMRQQNLLHQATYIFVFNKEGKLFVTKRTATKDIYPSYYEVAAGGVVAKGETVDSSAYRELEEELGISGVPLSPLFDFLFKNDRCQVWGSAFSCTWDGEIKLQPEEVESGRWMTIDEVLALSQTEQFTPTGMYALMKYKELVREASEGGNRSAAVGVLGVGLMGAPIAERLHKCGWKVTAYNRTVSRASKLQEAGVPVLGDAAAVTAQSSIIITVLSDAKAIREVLFDSRMDLKGKTVIQMGTIGPSESIALGKDCMKAGAVDYLEAPILGSIPEAKIGTLLVMVGSSVPTFTRLRPLFGDLDKNPMHVGPPGTAAALKLALNHMIAAETFTFSQALGFTESMEVNAKDFVSIVKQSPFYAPTFEKKLDKMLARSFENPNFPLRHLLKDVRLFKEEAKKVALEDFNYLGTMERLLERGMEKGYADLDYSALYMVVAFIKPLKL